ncbi:MAG: CAP domain-containing protein [Planctomycetota bacterium]
MIRELAICAAALFAADVAQEEPKKDEIQLIAIEKNVVLYTNAERKRYGLPPLEVDSDLVKSARKHCSWMTRARSLQHTRQSVAENIAMGQRNSQAVVRDWMNSSGHRANILNRSHQRIGVAAYRTESGTISWCQQFLR